MKKAIVAFATLVFLVGCGNNQQNDDDKPANVAQPSDNAVTYDCDGEVVKVDFSNDTDPRTVHLFFIDRDVDITLPEVETGSGAQYSDSDITFWTHQKEATLTSEATKTTLKCMERSTDEAVEGAIVDENGNTVPADCKMWFDGCNNCQITDNGMLACTRRACDENMMQPARCLDNEQQKTSSSNEQQACEDAGGVWSTQHNSCFEDPSTMAGPGEK